MRTRARLTLALAAAAATMVAVAPAPSVAASTPTVATSAIPYANRVAGADRYGTNAAILATYPTGPATLVVASGEGYADALAGAGLAGLTDPVALVSHDAIPAAVATQLHRLAPASIVVLGGTGSVSDTVVANLASYTTGAVTRVAGADRYATAAAVAARVPSSDTTVYLASGFGFADALSAGPLAAGEGGQPGPILLSDPTALPQVTAAALTQLHPQRVVVVGGTASVSNQVAAAAAQAAGVSNVTRIAGSDRYAPNLAAIGVADATVTGSLPHAVVASGAAFPDALSAAAWAARQGAPLLLLGPEPTNNQVSWLTHANPTYLTFAGGPGAISDTAALDLVAEQIGLYVPTGQHAWTPAGPGERVTVTGCRQTRIGSGTYRVTATTTVEVANPLPGGIAGETGTATFTWTDRNGSGGVDGWGPGTYNENGRYGMDGGSGDYGTTIRLAGHCGDLSISFPDYHGPATTTEVYQPAAAQAAGYPPVTAWPQGGVTLAADWDNPTDPTVARVAACTTIAADTSAPDGSNVGYVVTYTIVGPGGPSTQTVTSPTIYPYLGPGAGILPYLVRGPGGVSYELTVVPGGHQPRPGYDCPAWVTLSAAPAPTTP